MTTIQDLRNLINQIRRVASKDVILPEDHNLQTDGLSKTADILDNHESRIKTLEALPPPKYKLIATAYRETSGGNRASDYWLDSPWNNEYIIGETVFPDLNQKLQPYDLLIFNNEYSHNIKLIGEHTQIYFDVYFEGELYIYDGGKDYASQYFYKHHSIAYPKDALSWAIDETRPLFVAFIIPPDLSSFYYYSRVHSGVYYITPYHNAVRLKENAFLYRLQ